MRRMMVEAMREAWARPKAWAAGLGLLAVWCGLAWWWLSLPVASALDVALVGLVGAAALALPAWLFWRARRNFKVPGVWAALPLAVLIGFGAPWLLVRWVPELPGFAAQASSAGVRFALAAVCFVGAWLWLGRVGAKLQESKSNGTDASVE